MNKKYIDKILKDFKDNNLSISEASIKLGNLIYSNLGYAKVDHNRKIRNGYCETIFAEGKTINQIIGITKNLILNNEKNIIITRSNLKVYKAIVKNVSSNSVYYKSARIIIANKNDKFKKTKTYILVVSAGTSDMNVCEEAAITAEYMGSYVERLYDVGVAGIHRLLDYKNKIENASVIIVVAGMDAVLPSVITGLTSSPVIAVPTSIGYGTNLKGFSSLLTMLNSCSSGLTLVNIDNGYGAGYSAAIINNIANQAFQKVRS